MFVFLFFCSNYSKIGVFAQKKENNFLTIKKKCIFAPKLIIMNEKVRKERGLKVDNGFKLSLICLAGNEATAEQKLGIARQVKASLERAQKIINKQRNPRLFMNLDPKDQAFVNTFLPDDEQIKLV